MLPLRILASTSIPMLLATATLAIAQAQVSYRAGDIVVEEPWLRATPGGAKVAGGYMRITNTGTQPDRLIGGSAAVARGFKLHRSPVLDGVARMEPVNGAVEIGPKETLELKPGSLHAMLVDLQQGLKQGDVVKGTLVFERAGTVAIEYRVGGIGARDTPAAAGAHQHL
jgi:periplasmic copper chaperone A